MLKLGGGENAKSGPLIDIARSLINHVKHINVTESHDLSIGIIASLY